MCFRLAYVPKDVEDSIHLARTPAFHWKLLHNYCPDEHIEAQNSQMLQNYIKICKVVVYLLRQSWIV